MTTKKTIGELIEREVRKQQISITQFAEMIYCQRHNVYNIFRRSKIDIVLLKRISEVLNHNFFKDLADDLSLIDENEDSEKDKMVAQFFKAVPKALRKLGKEVSIIMQELDDEDNNCHLPDFGLPTYGITFTIGDTMKDRIGENHLLPIKTIRNSDGIEVELSSNLLYRTNMLNIKIDYKTEEEWYEQMKYAFQVYEHLNIKPYVS